MAIYDSSNVPWEVTGVPGITSRWDKINMNAGLAGCNFAWNASQLPPDMRLGDGPIYKLPKVGTLACERDQCAAFFLFRRLGCGVVNLGGRSRLVVEALLNLGDREEMLRRIEVWKELVDKGFRTVIERPDPSRSDCHAWGSHPIFHAATGFGERRPPFALGPQPMGAYAKCKLSKEDRRSHAAIVVSAPLRWGVHLSPEHGSRVPCLQPATFGDTPQPMGT